MYEFTEKTACDLVRALKSKGIAREFDLGLHVGYPDVRHVPFWDEAFELT